MAVSSVFHNYGSFFCYFMVQNGKLMFDAWQRGDCWSVNSSRGCSFKSLPEATTRHSAPNTEYSTLRYVKYTSKLSIQIKPLQVNSSDDCKISRTCLIYCTDDYTEKFVAIINRQVILMPGLAYIKKTCFFKLCLRLSFELVFEFKIEIFTFMDTVRC